MTEQAYHTENNMVNIGERGKYEDSQDRPEGGF